MYRPLASVSSCAADGWGLSRKVVAQLIGRSEEWLRQVEQGQARFDSIQISYRLVEVLRFVDPMELIDGSSSTRSAARDIDLQLTPLRRAIMDHPSTRAFAPAAEHALPSLATLRNSLEECWATWLNSSGRYTELAEQLPGVLIAARSIRSAAQAVPNGSVEEAGELLVGAYHLARILLTRVGNYDLAWLVADRPIGILAQTARTPLAAASSWHVASALLSLGYDAECRDYALAAAQHLATESEPGQRLSGALQLVAAEGAAGAGDLARSQDLMANAEQIAEKLDTAAADHRVWFGRIEVAITAMNIAVRLGQIDHAIKLAANVDIPEGTAVNVRVGYYLTTAYAYALRREDFAAVFALQQAERACAEDIRYDWMAHHTLKKLARSDHHLIRRDLAQLLTVAGLA
ncbi:hypothetical protein ACQPW1_14570 [Nocardia sp. CA-128927]|uniref:hypothetical protein n=1 Tax=Nocardia sp. CA-128927 TaxID=3239975 RepID=UPI003D96E57B